MSPILLSPVPLGVGTSIPKEPSLLSDVSVVHVGTRFRPATLTPCLVITDSWPGWLTVLPSSGFLCKQLVVPDPAAPWLIPLLQPHVGCQVFSWAQPLGLDSTLHAFGQGSSAVAEYLSQGGFSFWLFSADASCKSTPSSGLWLAHPDYGGGAERVVVFLECKLSRSSSPSTS